MPMYKNIYTDELMRERDFLLDKNCKKINYTDADGNEFQLLSNGAQTMLNQANIKTAVVRLPSCFSDEDGIKHKLTGIGAQAFFEQQALKHLYIPDGVFSIDNQAFTHCGSLLSVVMPASVQVIETPFWDCPTFEGNAVGKIYYTGSQEQWRALIDSRPYRKLMDYTPYDKIVQFIPNGTNFEIPDLFLETVYDEDSEMEISRVRVCELGGEVTIPEFYTDSDGVVRKITHIGRSSFAGNNKIEKVIIPSGIQRICDDAFYHCGNLREVVILKSEDELEIGMGAFFNCQCLEKVYVGRPCRWGEHALEKTNAQKIEID